jgi:hypothetical protein
MVALTRPTISPRYLFGMLSLFGFLMLSPASPAQEQVGSAPDANLPDDSTVSASPPVSVSPPALKPPVYIVPQAAPPNPASRAPAGSQDPKAAFVLEGIRAERGKLKTAICDVEFATAYEDKTNSKILDLDESRVMIAISDTGDFRMSWTYQRSIAEKRFLRGDGVYQSESPGRTGTFIRTKEKCIQWLEGQRIVDILPPSTAYPSWIKFFDVKAIGIYSWVEFQQSLGFEELIENLISMPVLEVSENSEGVYELVWELGSENLQWIIDVDCHRGFAPIAAKMRQRTTSSDPWLNIQEFQSDWEKVSSVWVPVRFTGRKQPKSDANTDTISLRLDWRSVNDTISDEMFTIKALNAPDAVSVVDSTLGSPIEIKVAGQPFPTDDAGSLPVRAGRYWWIVLNCLVLMMILVGIWYRGRRHSQP